MLRTMAYFCTWKPTEMSLINLTKFCEMMSTLYWSSSHKLENKKIYIDIYITLKMLIDFEDDVHTHTQIHTRWRSRRKSTVCRQRFLFDENKWAAKQAIDRRPAGLSIENDLVSRLQTLFTQYNHGTILKNDYQSSVRSWFVLLRAVCIGYSHCRNMMNSYFLSFILRPPIILLGGSTISPQC